MTEKTRQIPSFATAESSVLSGILSNVTDRSHKFAVKLAAFVIISATVRERTQS